MKRYLGLGSPKLVQNVKWASEPYTHQPLSTTHQSPKDKMGNKKF